MQNGDKVDIAAELAAADTETIREIVRQAESFLADQLKAALAADSRAMTFAGISAAGLSLLIGSAINLQANELISLWHLAPVGVAAVALFVALIFAIAAASPSRFEYCGNTPRNWVADIQAKISFVESMSGQAAMYARDIDANSAVLDRNHKYMRRAMASVLVGLALALLSEAAIVAAIVARFI